MSRPNYLKAQLEGKSVIIPSRPEKKHIHFARRRRRHRHVASPGKNYKNTDDKKRPSVNYPEKKLTKRSNELIQFSSIENFCY
ncbi:hypothetical protein H5410_035303 [Solanum commersonii]|uniref:Uncharacterized protein n=1 Tax=Solanum commersonii TaxID=4109 RepID=A0A9J5Y2H9_SOLCO|nr:hypothetical protein H5410_035303 [Solanum commersonii]